MHKLARNERSGEIDGWPGWHAVHVGPPRLVRARLGLMDEIVVSLVPVLIGKGIPFVGEFVFSPLKLSTPTIVEGDGVTHLTYQVKKD